MFWEFMGFLALVVISWNFLRRFLHSLKVGDYGKKYVLITGCDSGFGKKLTIRLDSMGFHVFPCCFTKEGCDNLSSICSTRVKPLPLDVTKAESIHNVFTAIENNLPANCGLWGLVNNAGITGGQLVAEMCTKEEYQLALDVMTIGPIEMTKKFLPLLRKSKGRLVTITSVMGRQAAVNSPYVVSKFALEGFCDSIRRELYDVGIKVSILEPGFVKTELLDLDTMIKNCKRSYQNVPQDIKDVYGANYLDNLCSMMTKVTENCSRDVDKVIDAYTNALTSRFPRARYVVGWDAKLFYVPLTFVPEWLSDTMLRLSRKILS